jgi:hypothetical protein
MKSLASHELETTTGGSDAIDTQNRSILDDIRRQVEADWQNYLDTLLEQNSA